MKQLWRQIQWCVPWLVFVLLIVAVVVTVATRAHGQLGGVQQPMFSRMVTTAGDDLPVGMSYRWVASDCTNQSPVTNWVDRINAVAFTNTANNPIWGTNKLIFRETNWLTIPATLQVRNAGSTNSDPIVAIISHNESAAAGAWLGSDSTYDFMSVLGGTKAIRFSGDASIGAVNNNVVFDYIYSGNSGKLYTNGIYIKDSFGHLETALKYVGTHDTSAANLTGEIYEIMIWTNRTLSASDIAKIHTYATNTYGFSP